MYLVLAPAHCTQCAPGDEEEALDYVDDDGHFHKVQDGNYRPDGGDDGFTKICEC